MLLFHILVSRNPKLFMSFFRTFWLVHNKFMMPCFAIVSSPKSRKFLENIRMAFKEIDLQPYRFWQSTKSSKEYNQRISVQHYSYNTLQKHESNGSPDLDSDFFNIDTGVLQGDTLVPYLFRLHILNINRFNKRKWFYIKKNRRYPAEIDGCSLHG